jgi:hypothetical protein
VLKIMSDLMVKYVKMLTLKKKLIGVLESRPSIMLTPVWMMY